MSVKINDAQNTQIIERIKQTEQRVFKMLKSLNILNHEKKILYKFSKHSLFK